jgi:hypothetical protein
MTKKEIKKQMFFIHHGTYPFDILVDIGIHTDKQLQKFLKKEKGITLDPDSIEALETCSITGGRTVMLSGGATIMRVSNDSDTFHEFLAHEIFHAVEFLFDRIGIQLSRESSEAYAYQIGWLHNQVYQKVKL